VTTSVAKDESLINSILLALTIVSTIRLLCLFPKPKMKLSYRATLLQYVSSSHQYIPKLEKKRRFFCALLSFFA